MAPCAVRSRVISTDDFTGLPLVEGRYVGVFLWNEVFVFAAFLYEIAVGKLICAGFDQFTGSFLLLPRFFSAIGPDRSARTFHLFLHNLHSVNI